MKILEMGIIRYALGVIVVVALAAGLAMACPKGTHPVCQYDPSKGKSVCHCVASERDDCQAKAGK